MYVLIKKERKRKRKGERKARTETEHFLKPENKKQMTNVTALNTTCPIHEDVLLAMYCHDCCRKIYNNINKYI